MIHPPHRSGEGLDKMAREKTVGTIKMIVLGLAGLMGLLLVGLGLLGWSRPGWAQFEGSIQALKVNVGEPQGLIVTSSLVGLSRDLVKAPVLRELLNEDFVFYYEEHDDHIGLVGALRRLAFEHEVRLADNVVALALSGRADVAFWPDDRGAARHWAVAMSRSSVATVLQSLVPLAAKDRQLSLIAEVPLEREEGPSAGTVGSTAGSTRTVPVLALRLSPRRTLAMASVGERVVVFSDPGLLFKTDHTIDPSAAGVLGALLSSDERRQSVWRASLGITSGSPAHQVVLRGPMLSFNYQAFFPALQALKVEVAAGGATLNSWVQQRPTTSNPASSAASSPASAMPWSALPADPAACAALPVDWARTRSVLGDPRRTGDAAPALAKVTDSLDGPAAICWYALSHLHTPLLVAHAHGPAPDAATLKSLMQWWLPKGADWDDASGTGRIRAPYGPMRVSTDPPHYRVSLRRVADWWLFSPDASLVTRAADTLARRYPSVADTLHRDPARQRATLAVVTPVNIAELLHLEALKVMTPSQSNFQQAAETQLFPRLNAFGKLAPAQAVLHGPPDALGWTALEWQALPPASAEVGR